MDEHRFRRRYPTSTISGYSEIDLLVFRDTGMILENNRKESSCRSKISINHSTVEYIHFLCENNIFVYMVHLIIFLRKSISYDESYPRYLLCLCI